MKTNREYRAFSNFELRKGDNEELIVHGVPIVFNQPTMIYEYEGIKYFEIIDRHAFDNCDMSDVIMNYNHGGKVVARLRNKTLVLNFNENQVEIDAYLGGTQEGRNLYEEIQGGYIDKMSFAFVVDVNGDEYDSLTHTRTIKHIKKLYDVSAVDIPAYDQTSISARSYFEEEYSKELRTMELDRLRKLAIAKTKI